MIEQTKQNNLIKTLLYILTIILVLAVLKLPSNIVHVLILVFFYAYVSTAWDILGGYAGQMSFGHSLFIGVGAYTSTLLLLRLGITPWIGLFVSGLIALVIGAFMGFLCFRSNITGFYFALVTIVFVEISRYLSLGFEWTGAAKGLYIPYKGNNISNLQFDSKYMYFYVIFAMYIGILILYKAIMKSKSGFYFLAIRENEEAAESIGINTYKYKMLATIISSFLVGVAGSFWAQYITFIDPYTMFDFMLSVQIIFFAVAGGRGTLFGPLVGAALFVPLSEGLRTMMGRIAGINILVYGIILILILRFMPDGIFVWVKDRLKNLSHGR
ncbi:MAG: branched-chain amino acid ABC transporter permease [Firmicutes bacterium]|nr:branched-chain amino acid ABC transporter permease [Bacillota bacterium]